MTRNIYKVVMAGGVGTRLWPLSRKAFPKQFHALLGDATMMDGTLRRAAAACHEHLLVVGNDEHRFLIDDALKDAGIDSARIILEPEPKNTAAAIALAALELEAKDPEAWMLVLPADHWIADDQPLVEALEAAVRDMKDDELVAFGIAPTRPETGYGYIEAENPESGRVCIMKKFVEKPDLETAQKYVDSGSFLWNSGMFLFPVKAVLGELEQHAPDILESVRAAHDAGVEDGIFLRPDAESFARTRSESIDYAVMENTKNAKVIPLELAWSDIGSWDAFHEQGRQMGNCDGGGNVCEGDVITEDCENSLFVSRSRLVSAIGLKDIAIIETSDAVLAMPASQAQNVKALLSSMKSQGRSEVDTHAKVYRPWGSYETVDLGERYQVKRIVVKPGGRLSLQMHHHRAEHWIIVSGTARVTRGEEEFVLSENESTYIPLGTVHRIENPGNIPLEFIEVQSGSYLGEDDIVRYEDNYGRA